MGSLHSRIPEIHSDRPGAAAFLLPGSRCVEAHNNPVPITNNALGVHGRPYIPWDGVNGNYQAVSRDRRITTSWSRHQVYGKYSMDWYGTSALAPGWEAVGAIPGTAPTSYYYREHVGAESDVLPCTSARDTAAVPYGEFLDYQM